MKVTRKSVYDWFHADNDFKQAYDDQMEALIDFAESKLMSSINNGSDTATIFFLKCKAKSRGYIDKTQVELSGDPENPIALEIKSTIIFEDMSEEKTKPDQ